MTGQQQQSMTSLVCSNRKQPTGTGAGGGKNRSPFVGEVRLISHQHDDDITSPLCSHIIDPFCSLLEGVHVWKRQQKVFCFFFISLTAEMWSQHFRKWCQHFVSPQWNKHWKQNKQASVATLAQSTYLWYRKLRLQQQSLWCNLEWGFEIALAPQCPTTATWSMEQGGNEEKANTKFKKEKKKKLKWARNGNQKKEKLHLHKHKMGRKDLKKNFYKKWMTPLRVSRGWINNHSLLVTNTPLFDQVKRIILKREGNRWKGRKNRGRFGWLLRGRSSRERHCWSIF